MGLDMTVLTLLGVAYLLTWTAGFLFGRRR